MPNVKKYKRHHKPIIKCRNETDGAQSETSWMKRATVPELQAELNWFKSRVDNLEGQLRDERSELEKIRKSESYRLLLLKESIVKSNSQMVDSLARMIGGPGF